MPDTACRLVFRSDDLKTKYTQRHSGNEKADEEAKTETPAQPVLFRHIWGPHFREAEQQAYQAELKEMCREDWEKITRKERIDRIDTIPFQYVPWHPRQDNQSTGKSINPDIIRLHPT